MGEEFVSRNPNRARHGTRDLTIASPPSRASASGSDRGDEDLERPAPRHWAGRHAAAIRPDSPTLRIVENDLWARRAVERLDPVVIPIPGIERWREILLDLI